MYAPRPSNDKDTGKLSVGRLARRGSYLCCLSSLSFKGLRPKLGLEAKIGRTCAPSNVLRGETPRGLITSDRANVLIVGPDGVTKRQTR